MAMTPLSLTMVFDETLFRIFAKHETREHAPVFRETFAGFERRNIKFARFSCIAKVIPETESSMATCEALAGRQRLGEGRREKQFRCKFHRRANQIGGHLRLGEETEAY